MARVTVEDCLKNVDNMYELVLMATLRARQICAGSDPLVTSKNRQAVTALREIAANKVSLRYENQIADEVSDDEIASLSN